MVMSETYLKAKILTQGVFFTNSVLEYAISKKAKIQNLVYNQPRGSSRMRPQELLITHHDGYQTVVSCVSTNKKPVIVDFKDNQLVAKVDSKIIDDVNIDFVKQPDYYSYTLKNGESIKKYISSCGLDELNIIPWKGCAISKPCLFCGINTVVSKNKNWREVSTAFNFSKQNFWNDIKKTYIQNLCEAISSAQHDNCFSEHIHVILISGNLYNAQLDLQSEIYSDIAYSINKLHNFNPKEGIVAVLMPPNDLNRIKIMFDSGIKKFVFNFEVSDRNLFAKYCPGKNDIGYDNILNSLHEAVRVAGRGNSWTNFVLGLEPIHNLLNFNETLAKDGIVSSANVLHIDEGSRLNCTPPSYDDVINYFYCLSKINKQNNQQPFYCSKALRTSLSNEAFDGRIKL